MSYYCNEALNFIDPKNEIFSQRLYRDNCLKFQFEKDNIFVKDLRIFHKIDLKDIIIIDNSILSFAFHLDNGIPILPFYDNKQDIEMPFLAQYLNSIVNTDDIREINKKFIKYDIDSNRSIASIKSFQSVDLETSEMNISIENENLNISELEIGSSFRNFTLKNLFRDSKDV